jgi:hypothetical protein
MHDVEIMELCAEEDGGSSLPRFFGPEVQELGPDFALLTDTTGDERSCFCTVTSWWPGAGGPWHAWPELFGSWVQGFGFGPESSASSLLTGRHHHYRKLCCFYQFFNFCRQL